MRKQSLLKLICLFAVAIMAVGTLRADDSVIKTASYGFGYDTGTKVLENKNLIEPATFIDGYKDFVAKKQPVYSEEQLAKASQDLNKLIEKEVTGKENVDVQELMTTFEIPADIKKMLSYGSGYMFGVQLSEGAGLLDHEQVVLGLKDAAEGKANTYTPEELQTAMTEFGKLFSAKIEDEMREVATPNIEAGKKFMENYVKQDGVKVTPEGIAYKVLKVGTGASPKAEDAVKVHYAGRLIDGTEFDSSVKRGEPAEFAIQEVIDGWKIVLPQMKIGDKWEVVIPYDLAYKLEGQPHGPVPIKPGDTLIFEMELLGIK